MQLPCLIRAVSRAAAFVISFFLFLAPAASNATVLRIMPLGDSITDGYTVSGGYRVPLCQMLIAAGYRVEFVGSVTNNNPAPYSELHHEGHSGYRIDQILSGLPAWVQSAGEPDIILLLIGTNDYGQRHDPAGAIDRLDELMAEIVALRPQARLVVANLLQRTDDRMANAAIQGTFNPGVASLVKQYAAAGRRVYFTDMCSALAASDLADGLHPNSAGYARMATNWFGVITKIVGTNTAQGTLVNFDGAAIGSVLNRVAMPPSYQPVPGLTMGYENVGIFFDGPDHTSGLSGPNHYNTYSLNGANPQVFTFSRPVAVPSFYASTYAGGDGGVSREVAIKAYADAAGRVLVTNVSVVTPPHSQGTNYVWTCCESLKATGANIMRVEVFSPGNAQVDDLMIDVATNLGPLQAIHLAMPCGYTYAGRYEQATVLGDYLYVSNVEVTAEAGVVYASSNPKAATAATAGVMAGVQEGSTIVTAYFQGCSNSLPLSVLPGALMDFNAGLMDMGVRTTVPPNYQPVPGLTITYQNVGLFSGGPDHTSGLAGGNRYNAYQFLDGQPQGFIFSRPVSVPSLWLSTYFGRGEPVVIQAYGDAQGQKLLGTVYADTETFAGAGNYRWRQCTNLNIATFNGLIRRMEISAGDGVNANLDDLNIIVNTNLGAVQRVKLILPTAVYFRGTSCQATILADYESAEESTVAPEARVLYRSSNPEVVAVSATGLVYGVGEGRATITATLEGRSGSMDVAVLRGNVVDFNTGLGDIGSYVPIPATYQPIPGVRITYGNVGLFNGGPDNTTHIPGGNRYNTYQFQGDSPQVFTFNQPVSLPSLMLATYDYVADDLVTINAFGDAAGADFLGSVFVHTAPAGGPGRYVWTQCTNLNSATFNGLIRRVEFSARGNANLDDLAVDVNTNLGALQGIRLALTLTNLSAGMMRQATVSARYQLVNDSEVTTEPGILYSSSATNVVAVDARGLVRGVAPGTAVLTAEFRGHRDSVEIHVSAGRGALVDFTLPGAANRTLLTASYQPVPGLTMSYGNVGIFNGGPDHTAGMLGGQNYSTYQFRDGDPQIFTFSRPVGLPSMWLATYWGGGDQLTINAYGDEAGANLLGTVFFGTATFAGPKNYNWWQCTNFDCAAYNGLIRRIELFDSHGNAQLDDLEIRVP